MRNGTAFCDEGPRTYADNAEMIRTGSQLSAVSSLEHVQMKRIAIVLAVWSTVVFCGESSHAQRRVPHYQRTPTMSPWINLFRTDSSGSSNYFGLVRPQQRLQQFANQTRRAEQLQRDMNFAAGNTFNQLENTLEQSLLQQRPAGRSQTVMRAGTFMDYSRFFPQSAVIRRNRVR